MKVCLRLIESINPSFRLLIYLILHIIYNNYYFYHHHNHKDNFDGAEPRAQQITNITWMRYRQMCLYCLNYAVKFAFIHCSYSLSESFSLSFFHLLTWCCPFNLRFCHMAKEETERNPMNQNVLINHGIFKIFLYPVFLCQ